MNNILDKIVSKKRERLEDLKNKKPIEFLKEEIKKIKSDESNRFSKAIKRLPHEPIKIIAEIKRASPVKGFLRDYNIEEMADAYISAGVDAISIITEEDFFYGSPKFITQIRKRHPGVPILRKDFIFDEYQIYETKALGADALLLIASIIGYDKSIELIDLSEQLGLEILFEVHDRDEVEMALKLDMPIIGINNRNLKTMEISLETSINLRRLIPDSKIIVSESGIHNYEEIERLLKNEIDAVLVGTSLILSNNPIEKILYLKGKLSKN